MQNTLDFETHRHTILVVDDSPQSLGMLHASLDTAGYNVLVALNGQQALTISAQLQPDIILLDAVMPVMDGFTCCQQLRLLLPTTPVIFMTGLTETENIVRAFESGGSDYIAKPIRSDELLARIKAHAHNANLIQEATRALDTVQQHIFCVSQTGKILWSTPQAKTLLAYIDEQQCNTQDTIAKWINGGGTEHTLYLPKNNALIDTTDNTKKMQPTSSSAEDKKHITLNYFKKTAQCEHLLKIANPDVYFNSDILTNKLHLTQREAEVLLWLAHGKSNKEIAGILEMSPRTVNKHLEQIFNKIQVDNRSAATALAVKTLHGLNP